MADNRFSSWKEDDLLKDALKTYVKQGLQREEAIDFLRKDFPQYAWSIRTLDRRLRQHCRLSEKSFVLFNLFYPEVHKVDLWQVYGIAKVAVGSNPI